MICVLLAHQETHTRPSYLFRRPWPANTDQLRVVLTGWFVWANGKVSATAHLSRCPNFGRPKMAAGHRYDRSWRELQPPEEITKKKNERKKKNL